MVLTISFIIPFMFLYYYLNKHASREYFHFPQRRLTIFLPEFDFSPYHLILIAMRICFLTLGCKQNQYETELVREYFLKNGAEEVSLDENPDVVFINTCSVTSLAGQQSRNLVRRALRRGARVIVSGCHAILFPDEFSGENIEILEDPWNLNSILEKFSTRRRGYVLIERGCNNFCSYCIVPYARGRVRSRPKEDIIKEVKNLIKNGHKEIVLTGTHMGQYGKDTGEKLSSLLLTLAELGARIRLTSINPDEADEVLKAFHHPMIAPHLHLALQSGSDKVLKLMRRNYTREDIKKLVYRIKEIREDAGIGADFIVGFPGEGEREFEETYRLVEELPFSYLHVFRYSERPMTLALLYPERVPERIRKKRSKTLRELAKKKFYDFRKELIGKTYTVLVEKKKDSVTGLSYGFTPNYVRVQFEGNGRDEVVVRIERIDDEFTYGKVLH